MRPRFHTAIGEYLKGLREAKQWTMRQAADIASRRAGSGALTRQVMLRMEWGQVKNPKAVVLRAYAALYGIRYEDLARRYVESNYSHVYDTHVGSDLAWPPRHTEPEESLTGGIHDGGAETEVSLSTAHDELRANLSELASETEELDAGSALDALESVEHDLQRVGAIIRRSRIALVLGRTPNPRVSPPERISGSADLRPKANRQTRRRRP